MTPVHSYFPLYWDYERYWIFKVKISSKAILKICWFLRLSEASQLRETFLQLDLITPEVAWSIGLRSRFWGALPKYHIWLLFASILFEEGSMAIKAECNRLKLPELPGLRRGRNPKRQEAKSRNLASRVPFLLSCPIEISHCGQTKHQWQQQWTLKTKINNFLLPNPAHKSLSWF